MFADRVDPVNGRPPPRRSAAWHAAVVDEDGTTRITNAADGRVDDFRRLNDQRFRRRYEADECFIAEGFVAIDRLVESAHRVRAVLLAPSRLSRFAHRAELARRGVPVLVAEPDVLARIVGFDLHRGIVAAADRLPSPTLDDALDGARRVVALEGLNDGENVGAIARAARAFACDALVLDDTCTDPYSRRVVRVSMGEVLALPVVRAGEGAEVRAALRRHGFESWAMTPAHDADDLWSCPVPERLAIVMGREGPGLSAETLGWADRRVRIPIAPAVDSLNVGHATAVTLAVVDRP